MEFSLDEFVAGPSFAKIEKCKKKDLLMVANCYNVQVPYSANKGEIKRLLCAELVEQGIIPEPATDVAVAGGAAGDAPMADVKAAGAAGMLATGVGLEPVIDPVMGNMTTEDLRIALQIKEVETKNRQLEVQAMHLRIRALELEKGAPVVSTPMSPLDRSAISTPAFDISRHIALVPPFRESEVDSYFSAFERIAAALSWPKEFWSLLLQCKLVGKAQEVCASLSIEDSLDYKILKKTVLQAYELVPEAYRQKFRNSDKTANQTYVEFVRDKSILFDKWCQACNVKNMAEIRELILLEEFKKCLPERIVVYLNEQKESSVTKAAVLADEFILTHKSVFSMPAPRVSQVMPERRVRSPKMMRKSTSPTAGEGRECFYCHEPGHLIAVCPILRKKGPHKGTKPPAGVGFINTVSPPVKHTELLPEEKYAEVDPRFKPFVSHGFVSLTGEQSEKVPVTILRDTAAYHSFMLANVLPLSNETSCSSDLLVWGIKMSELHAPLHMIHLHSALVSGQVKVAVLPQFPISGVSFILGNDLAGGKVFPLPEVVSDPISSVSACCSPFASSAVSVPNLFPVCAITRAQARKLGENVDLSESFMATLVEGEPSCSVSSDECENVLKCINEFDLFPADTDLSLNVTREMLTKAQMSDPSLTSCLSSVVAAEEDSKPVRFFLDNGVLMRRWSPDSSEMCAVNQVVVPTDYRAQILSLAHDSSLAGHLGVKKTYHRVLRNFFWPGLKTDVSKYCRTCHTCQVVGKPNQPVPPAPLHPIPVLGEPFERVLIDCVGPLPRTKSGHQYILTVMCAATRYPEAIPLRTLRAKPVVKALTKFFSTFGLPKTIQSDQGTNFMSKLFAQVMRELKVKHATSSPYHPESQGALERFHQTLKSMLRKYCLESNREWDEGLPLLLFAVRETPQESLGFSPCDLVFGHTVRGPLRLLKEKWLAESPKTEHKLLDYVSSFRKRLNYVCQLARDNLSQSQAKMKSRYDKKSVLRVFQPGDKVLVLLPLPGSSLHARFSGPYTVERKISDTDYVVQTPDRKRKSRVCHINMLKRYFSRVSESPLSLAAPVMSVSATPPQYHLADDGLAEKSGLMPAARLRNSEVLSNLEGFLAHLSDSALADVRDLIENNLLLFSDHPRQTSVLFHDIDVEGHKPIKQHAYRVNPAKRAMMQEEVSYLVEHGLAVPSTSAWSSPCVLVPKPDHTPRFCNDYRKVNSVTKPDSFPLPRMEDCIDRVGSAKYVTKLDLLKGYWQVPLTPRASEISAFVTPDTFLQYTVMPFGLRNAPATFQRLMRIVLSGVENCEAYLDDVVAYSSTWADHLHTLSLIFSRLREASLTLNLAKCEFGRATVTYLGKQVGQGQVRPLAEKVQAIIDFPVPPSKKALRRFLGMCGYYRGFCRNFSDVVAPLTGLVSPLKSFIWSPACQAAFESAKALLCNAPVLAAPCFTRPFKLEVDASACGAGAVLLQEDSQSIDHPVSYFSKKFNKHQLNYSTIEKEALSLLLALQYFEVYLGSSSQPVSVFTDHNPLVFLAHMQNSNQRLMRWSLLLQDFNLQIRHKKGTENVIADALSRCSAL